MRGIGKEGTGQGAGLMAVHLVGVVEDGVQLGVGRQHVIVEHGGDGGAMLLEDRHGGLDELDLFRGERHGEGIV